MIPLTLSMIVRNCAETLERCLHSVDGYVDEIIVVNTAIDESEKGFKETNDVCRKYMAKIYHRPWDNDFATPRNLSFDRSSNNLVMWLDSDDIVVHMDRFRNNIEMYFTAQHGQCMVVPYYYEFDRNGECTTQLMRERVVDRRVFHWRMPIHECLCADWVYKAAALPGEGGHVLHDKKFEDRDQSLDRLVRNLHIFETKFDSNTWDKRALYYWGNTLYGLGRHDEAIDRYKRYMKYADNKPEMYAALVTMSEGYRVMMDQKAASAAALKAMELCPDWPSCHLAAAEAAVASREWERAISFARNTIDRQRNKDQELVCNPKALMGRPHYILAYCYGQMLNTIECLKHAREANRYYGEDENLKCILDIVNDTMSLQKCLASYSELRSALEDEGDEEKIRNLEKAIPNRIKEEPEVCSTIKKIRDGSKRSLAIFCPFNGELWGPESIVSGIGGSEECVINLSKELAALGWSVEVYAHTQCRGEIDGVTWYPNRSWTGERDDLDVAIMWRSPRGPNDIGMRSKTSYLWLHDIPIRDQWSFDTSDLYNKIFFLSSFQRSLFDWVPDDKAFVTMNAMDPSLFVPEDQLFKADRWKLIWPSDPSRGLQLMAPWWEALKSRFPKLELHVFYGWSPLFLQGMKTSQWHNDVFSVVEGLRKQPGVEWHGRVGQKEMNEWASKCSFWPYFTDFPEVFCINALKMQAHGCWPITPTSGSLSEVVKYGDLFDVPQINFRDEPEIRSSDSQHRYVELLMSRLDSGPPAESLLRDMVSWARKFTWKRVAMQWTEIFNRDLQSSQDYKLVRKGSFNVRPLSL